MPVEVILPKVDMDMATGQILRWFVAEGASVKKGETLFEIETDKAAMEIDAPASGTIRDICGQTGVDIAVGSPVAWIYPEGEAHGGVAAAQTNDGPSSPTGPSPRDPSISSGRGEGGSSDVSARLSPSLRGEGKGEGQQKQGEGRHIDGAIRATPLARRLAREAGLDLGAIAGSGPNGRVVRADVETAREAPPSSLPASSRPLDHGDGAPIGQRDVHPLPPAGGEVSRQSRDGERVVQDIVRSPAAAVDATLALFPADSYTLVPHDPMRRTIARRLVEAKTTIPHFYLSVDCDIAALLALRTEINASAPIASEDGQPAFKLSVNDMVIKAWATALRNLPAANVSWTDTHLVAHNHVDIGVAVSIPGGLTTPIIRQAERKTLSIVAAEMRDLAGRARSRKLRPDEYQGGTTAISNLGMFGISSFQAVINPPHATILAVGAGEERAGVQEGSIVVKTMMSVTLSADHRAIDGALAAELVATFKRCVENPLQMLV